MAVARAWATAGRTILFSALTVAAALSGLLLFGPISTLSALGAAGVSIAVVAMLVSLTFTAALLGLLKRRLRPSRRQQARQLRGDEVGFFYRLVRVRPAPPGPGRDRHLGAAAGGRLAPDHRGGRPARHQRPAGQLESVQVNDELATVYHRSPAAAITVVARTDPATLQQWAARWAGTTEVTRGPAGPDAGDGTVSSMGIDVVGDPQGPAARDWWNGYGRTGRPVGSPGSPATRPSCTTCSD